MSRIHTFLALVLMALSFSGCSVPQYEEEDSSYYAALSSYQNCMQRRHPVDRGTACDRASAGMSGTSSYQNFGNGLSGGAASLPGGQLNGGSSYTPPVSNGGWMKSGATGTWESELPEESEKTFRAYWSHLSEEERHSVLQQWNELSDLEE